MFETKEELLEWLSTQNKFSIKLHLTRVKRACELLGNPQEKLNMIHIAGTNGKGSTANYLNSLLIESGYRVGMFISPFIITFNERIQINHEYISDEDLLACANKISPIIKQVEEELEDEMTEFEIITVLSFVYFSQQNIDYVIYEVGMGGKLDSTNVITPLVCAITNVSYDHMNVLGSTIEEIASKKIGIAKTNVPLFTTETKENVLDVFSNYCEEMETPFQVCDKNLITNAQFTESGMTFTYKGIDCFIPMLGMHQISNVLLALTMYDYLMNLNNELIHPDTIINGLKNAKWSGRLEVISKKPFVLIDGAHNIDGVKTLTNAMQYYLAKGYKIHTVFSALKDKETDKMLALLQSISEELTLTSFSFYRANTAKNLYEQTNKINVSYHEDYKEVLHDKYQSIKEGELLLITGSLYFISNVIRYFKTIDKEC